MPVVIAHGQPKSGSTSLYVSALELAALANGEEYYTFRNARLGDDFVDFQPVVTRETVERVAAEIGPGEFIILKTHGALTPDLVAMIESRDVLAFTSFRDPRDSVLSILDAGQSDRDKGSSRWFTIFTDVEQLAAPVRGQFKRVVPWIEHCKVLAMPYYLTAYRQSSAIEILARHLQCGAYGRQVAVSMEARRSSVPEWNKGLADRYLEEMNAREVRFLNEAFADVLPEHDRLLRDSMSDLKHHIFCEWLIAERDNRMQSKLASQGP